MTRQLVAALFEVTMCNQNVTDCRIALNGSESHAKALYPLLRAITLPPSSQEFSQVKCPFMLALLTSNLCSTVFERLVAGKPGSHVSGCLSRSATHRTATRAASRDARKKVLRNLWPEVDTATSKVHYGDITKYGKQKNEALTEGQAPKPKVQYTRPRPDHLRDARTNDLDSKRIAVIGSAGSIPVHGTRYQPNRRGTQ